MDSIVQILSQQLSIMLSSYKALLMLIYYKRLEVWIILISHWLEMTECDWPRASKPTRLQSDLLDSGSERLALAEKPNLIRLTMNNI